MWGAAIVMTPLESAMRGSLEGSHGGRSHVRDDHGPSRYTAIGDSTLSETLNSFDACGMIDVWASRRAGPLAESATSQEPIKRD